MDLKDRLGLTAIHMKQANVGLAMKSLFGGSFGTDDYRSDGDYFYPFSNGADAIHFNDDSLVSFAKAYFECSPLSGIINRKAQAFTNGETYVINTEGINKDKESNSEIAKKIRRLMNNPNKLQTREDFENQIYIYSQLFGFAVVLFMKPVGYPNYDADAMWVIPPHLLEITEKSGIFYKGSNSSFERIRLTYGNEFVDLPLDNVAIIRDIMPSFNSVLIPDSRVKTLKMPINNIIGAYESRNVLINSRGSLGILTNQTQDALSALPLKKGDKEEMYRDFRKFYGIRKGQAHIMITSANMKWQSMALPTKDLMLFEEIEDDGNRICDTYMFPPELFAKMNGGTTFSNIATATRNLYQDAIMPEAKNIYAQWNKIFDTPKYNLEMGREYWKLPALQAANKEEAEAMLRLNQAMQIAFLKDVVSRDEWRVKLGFDPRDKSAVWYSDVKETLTIQYNTGDEGTQLDQTFLNDGINEGNNDTALPSKT